MGAMRIDEIYAAGDRPVFSFEFFPPKTPEGEANLYLALASLRSLSPDFVSVTYGAGGSTRSKTLEIVSRIRDEIGLEAMAHFTCVGATVDELRSTLDDMSRLGFENVLALRGDPPQGQQEWTKTEGGLEYSRELVELISADYQLSIGAACFPETHLHATSAEDDLRYLKEKVDAGVSFLITQLFFDNALYYDFVARARAIGIEVPIVPGILPITTYNQLSRVTSMCGATIPDHVLTDLHQRRASDEAVAEFGVAYATMQCADLLANGAPGIHFYTLNRSPATRAILSALRLLRALAPPPPPPPPGAPPPTSPPPRRRRRRGLDDLTPPPSPAKPTPLSTPPALLPSPLLSSCHRTPATKTPPQSSMSSFSASAGEPCGALVAHVDAVVLAIGAHAPGAQEPAPAADAVLAQLALRRRARSSLTR